MFPSVSTASLIYIKFDIHIPLLNALRVFGFCQQLAGPQGVIPQNEYLRPTLSRDMTDAIIFDSHETALVPRSTDVALSSLSLAWYYKSPECILGLVQIIGQALEEPVSPFSVSPITTSPCNSRLSICLSRVQNAHPAEIVRVVDQCPSGRSAADKG